MAERATKDGGDGDPLDENSPIEEMARLIMNILSTDLNPMSHRQRSDALVALGFSEEEAVFLLWEVGERESAKDQIREFLGGSKERGGW